MNLNLVTAAVSAFVNFGVSSSRQKSHGAMVSTAMTELFADVADSDENFFAAFGNGKAPNAEGFIAGALPAGIRAELAKVKDDAEKRAKRAKNPAILAEAEEAIKSALGTLKTRLSQCRRLYRAGGIPQKNEDIQAALKRYAKEPVKKDAKPEGNAVAEKVLIAPDASMDDISEALSVWIANHGNAAAGLAAKLADFMPVTVKRTRKQA